jgi:hypothetical protein
LKSTLKKLLALALVLMLGAAALEIGATLYYRIGNGAFLSNAELLSREPGDFVRKDAAQGCSYRDGLFPHPYLAWVRNANPPCGWDQISGQGLYGPDIPAQRTPGVFRVLLTGGSVAVQLGFVPAEHSLETVLNERFGTEALRFEVINAALEAWKQPQQLFTTVLYGNAVDGIVSLEGFNEFFAILAHSENGRRMDLPWQPSYVATNPYFEESGPSQVASWVNQRLYEFNRDHWLGSRSKFLMLAARAARTQFAAWAGANQKDWSEMPTSLESLFDIGPGEPLDAEQWNLGLYAHYLRSMWVLAADSESRLAIFIQPSPAAYRNITSEEAAVVGDLSYGPQYIEFEQALLQLDDLPVYSLLDIYQDVESSIYSDPVHQPMDGPGYRLMVNEIVDVLEREWTLGGQAP